MIETILQADGNLLIWIQDHVRTPFLTMFFQTVTALGNAGLIWIALTLLLLVIKSTRKIGYMCAMALAFSLLFNNGFIKNLVARPRPYTRIEELVPLIPLPSEYSFPSGHTVSSFAAGWTVFRRLPGRYGIPALVLAALVSVSRLYVGVHYPTDVLCGIVLGIVLSAAAQWTVDKILEMAEKRRGPSER